MARPLAVAGLSFYGAVMMISFVPGEYRLFTALVISALCLPTVFLFPKALKRFAIVLVCAAVSGAIYFTAYTHIVYYPLIDLKDFQLEDKAALTGEVVDISQASSGYRYIINIHGINGEKIKPRKAIWYSSFKISDYYDIIELEGYLTPDSDGSRLTFDDYWTSQGVYFHLRSYDEPRIFPTKSKPPMYFFRNLRDNISSHIVKQSPLGNSGELVGIMLGEKSFINSSGILAYQRSGIMHILCVSGLHLLMLTTVLFAVLKKIRIPQRISAAIVIIFALSFMALTGFSYPILRSGIMAIIMLSGKIFYRNADSLSSVGLATLFILLINPFAVRSASFTLSLLATLGIIILYPHLKKQVTSKLKSSSTLIKNFVNAFFVSVSAAIFTLPASLLFFDEISIAAPITNALLYPFFTFAMCFGYLAGLFALLPFLPFLSGAAQFMAESALEIIKRICDIIVKIPYAYFPAGFTFLLIWMFGTLLIMLFCAFSKHRSKLYPIAAVISLVILAAGSFSNMYFLRDTVTFTFIETQRGSDVILSYGEKAAIISTAGNDLLSYPGYLRGKGIKDIEALCIIRADSTALRNTERFLQNESAFTQNFFVPDDFPVSDTPAFALLQSGTKENENKSNGTILHSVSQAQLTLGGALTVDFTESPVTAFRFLFGKFAVIVSESAQDAVEFSAYGRANIVLFYDLSEENTEYKSLVRQNKYYIMDFTQQNDLKLSEIFDSTAYQRTVLLLHPNGNIRIFGENDFVL